MYCGVDVNVVGVILFCGYKNIRDYCLWWGEFVIGIFVLIYEGVIGFKGVIVIIICSHCYIIGVFWCG